MHTYSLRAVALAAIACGFIATPVATAQSSFGLSSSALPPTDSGSHSAYHELFRENFDGVDNPARFTHSLPDGWDSSTEGVSSGEARWNGWTLSTIRDWTWASGTDQRHWFTGAHDQLAIIDSKQQRLNATDSMTAGMTTPAIDVAGHDAVDLTFDSHYRQGSADQRAQVSVSFDEAAGEVAKVFDSDAISTHEALRIQVPAGARSMRVSFDYLNGNDDWYWAIDNVAVSAPLPEPESNPTIIDVISDIQGDIADYEDAIAQLNAMPDRAAALVINGDAVDQGTEELWDEFQAATARSPHASGKTIMTAGNHEMYGNESSDTHLQRFYAHSGTSSPVTEQVVAGVPIITINSEYYSDVDRGGKEPFVRLSPENLAYLDERLAHWEQEGVTPLVFAHYLLPQTVAMSHSAWYQNDYEDLEAVSNVLNKYTNFVMFTGHSHASLLHQNDWWGMRRYDGTGAAGATGFPVVNTGAILNQYMPEGDNDERILDGPASSGLRVKVFKDRVRVESYDFISHSIIRVHDFPRR